MVIAGSINVKVVKIGVICLGIFVGDMSHDDGIHIIIGVAQHVVDRQRVIDQSIHRCADQIAVHDRHGVVGVVLATGFQFLDRGKDGLGI